MKPLRRHYRLEIAQIESNELARNTEHLIIFIAHHFSWLIVAIQPSFTAPNLPIAI